MAVKKAKVKKKKNAAKKAVKKTVRGKRKSAGEKIGFFDRFPLHTPLLALYPIIFLFTYNISEMYLNEIFMPLLISLGCALGVFGILYLFMRDVIKSGIIASSAVIFFFAYGHIAAAFDVLGLPGGVKTPHCLTVFLLGGALVYADLIVFKGRKKNDTFPLAVNRYLNFFSVILISMVLVQSIWGVIKYRNAVNLKSKEYASDLAGDFKTMPDIYYILVDGKGRSDILKSLYDYDDSGFISALESKGFKVPGRSISNYPSTLLSMASLMNYEYLDSAASRAGKKSDNRIFLREKIRNSKAVKFLRRKGYKYYVLPGGHSDTELINAADRVFRPEGMDINNFYQALFNTTALSIINAFSGADAEPMQYAAHRNRILYNLEKIGETASMPGPKFVFAYFVSPHPPFVFDRHGMYVHHTRRISFSDGNHSGIPKDEYIHGYREQTMFMDNRLEKAVESIIANSSAPPVIIIQADHGPGSGLIWEGPDKTDMRERFSIFGAYYLPGIDAEKIPEDMSPVNNFRLLFSEYFGKDIEMLENRAYFSRWSRPYDFIDVTGEV
ncbi:MAG: hypothetical protein ACLFP1_09355, partial [Candidatus Goldiibacteriota bacterium]